jgi:hypothetical protein
MVCVGSLVRLSIERLAFGISLATVRDQYRLLCRASVPEEKAGMVRLVLVGTADLGKIPSIFS